MEFLAIMFVGTLVAIWAVAGSRPKKNVRATYLPPVVPPEMNSPRPPENWQYEPMDELEHAEALKRHDSDPTSNPYPSAVPPEQT